MHKNSSLWCSYPPQFSYTHAQLADQRGSLMQHIAPWSIPGSGVAATQLPQPSCYWKQVSRGTWFQLPDKLCVLKNTILTQFQLASICCKGKHWLRCDCKCQVEPEQVWHQCTTSKVPLHHKEGTVHHKEGSTSKAVCKKQKIEYCRKLGIME